MDIIARDARQLGAAIRRLRRQRGLTQSELAEMSGHNQTTISDLERGLPGARETLYGVLAALRIELVLRDRAGSDEVEQPTPDIGAVF